MTRVRLLWALALVVAACTGSDAGVSTTTMVVATTTTSTVPVTTTTTTIPTYPLSGRIIDPHGSPVVRASVLAGDVAASTGSDGWFALETTAPGPLTATKPGWTDVEIAWDGTAAFVQGMIRPTKVRGLHVGAKAAGDDAMYDYLLGLADETAVNTLVLDTKQEGGKVLYDTAVVGAHEIGAVEVWYDPVQRIAQAREHGLYTITRVVVFEDSFRVRAHPEEKLAGPWVDPLAETAWDYNIALAVEACDLGFDEIQFDYVRFPSGQTGRASGQLNLTQEERVGAIEGFLAKARDALRPKGCAVSADIFAIVVATPDDQGIGQRPEELSRQLDAISPMVYPSHYAPGWLGFPDPNDHPYAVTADAIEDALPRLDEGTMLRPWLQGFWWSNSQIRSSIQAAEDRDVGWILWNAASNFDRAALPSDDEVTG